MSKLVSLQEVYTTLQDCAIDEGVPAVAEWIRDVLEKEYQVRLAYDSELDDLNK